MSWGGVREATNASQVGMSSASFSLPAETLSPRLAGVDTRAHENAPARGGAG